MMRWNRYFKIILLLFNILLLSSCTLLAPVRTPYINRYMLTEVPFCMQNNHPRAGVILVLTPETKPAYNTTQIAYSTRPFQISYFAENEWAETPSQMVSTLIMQTLQNTRHFRAVIPATSTGNYDYVLSTQILALRLDFTCRRPVLHFILVAHLSRAMPNRIIATRQFYIRQSLCSITPYEGVLAANRAVSKALGQLAQFTVSHT